MHSSIYEGLVTHHRREPVDHQFRYRLFMVYLDLDELPALTGPRALIGTRRGAACSFLRRDHLLDSSQGLREELAALIHRQTGESVTGPIRLLTQLRWFGWYMSPLNLYYVFDRDDTRVETIVAEVNNTPWNERHCYVLWDGNRAGNAPGATHVFQHQKEFHVSPFMEMDVSYRWQLDEPGSELAVHIANFQRDRPLFHAAMHLQRRELTRPALRRMAFRYPLMTARISGAIWYQALKLWWKKCPFYPHPRKLNPPPTHVRPRKPFAQPTCPAAD